MSNQAYLLSIARTLRDTVVPAMEPGSARLAVLGCVRILLRLAQPQVGEIEPAPLPLEKLPPELRDALAVATNRSLAAHEVPSENSALAPNRAAALDAAVAWIEDAQTSGNNRQAMSALVEWEGELQDAAERIFAALETPAARDQDKSTVIDPRALEAYFQTRHGPQVKLTSFNQLHGGTSKQTALISLSGAKDLPTDFVIRRDQIAATMTGSVVHEFPLLQAVYDAGVAVPRPLFLEQSSVALGKPFVALERMAGKSMASHFFVPPDRETALGLAEQMAKLHAIPVQKFAGVFDDLPQSDSVDRRQQPFEKMCEEWRHFSKTPSVTMSAAFRWMQDNIDCAKGPMTLVHGDIGFHNMLVDGKRFVAMLDWETAHIDNPAGDLGYVRPAIEQMLPWQEFFDHYIASGGQPVTQR